MQQAIELAVTTPAERIGTGSTKWGLSMSEESSGSLGHRKEVGGDWSLARTETALLQAGRLSSQPEGTADRG